MWKLNEQIFYNWDSLRLHLVNKHNIATVEDDPGLPALLKSLGIELYVQPATESVIEVPQILSMYQCQAYLAMMPAIEGRSVYDVIVEDVLPTMSLLANIEWRTRNEVWRPAPMVEQMRILFGWSHARMDEMFTDAFKLT